MGSNSGYTNWVPPCHNCVLLHQLFSCELNFEGSCQILKLVCDQVISVVMFVKTCNLNCPHLNQPLQIICKNLWVIMDYFELQIGHLLIISR